jgi:hypothetical protein
VKNIGYALICIGIIYLLIAFNMDVSVSSSPSYIPGIGSVGGGEFANFDLMAKRQNHLIIAALMTLVGVLLAIFGKDESPINGSDNSTLSEVAPTDFDGEFDLSVDSYRLWLAKHYQIERNDVFDRFVIGLQTFYSLDDALAHAHSLEVEKIANEAEKIADEKIKQKLVEDEVAANREFIRLSAEKADAEWQENRPKIIIGIIILIGLSAAAYFLFRETPEELIARIASEEAEKVEFITGVEQKFAISLPKDASNIEVKENAADYAFWCNDEVHGTLLTFRTELTKKAVKELFAKKLGEGIAAHGSSPNAFDWGWNKNKVHYTLSMFNEMPPTDVDFCMVK